MFFINPDVPTWVRRTVHIYKSPIDQHWAAAAALPATLLVNITASVMLPAVGLVTIAMTVMAIIFVRNLAQDPDNVVELDDLPMAAFTNRTSKTTGNVTGDVSRLTRQLHDLNQVMITDHDTRTVWDRVIYDAAVALRAAQDGIGPVLRTATDNDRRSLPHRIVAANIARAEQRIETLNEMVAAYENLTAARAESDRNSSLYGTDELASAAAAATDRLNAQAEAYRMISSC